VVAHSPIGIRLPEIRLGWLSCGFYVYTCRLLPKSVDMVLWFDRLVDHDREIENNLGQALQDEIIARTERQRF
jgi:hypothetical protein